MVHIIRVDMTKLSSIRKMERLKAMYENMGLNLKSTRQVGFEAFELKYD